MTRGRTERNRRMTQRRVPLDWAEGLLEEADLNLARKPPKTRARKRTYQAEGHRK